MSTPARQRSRRGEGDRLRQALVDAAAELLERSPDIEQLSVRAVTSRVGVSPSALYVHFADKDELARAVKKHSFAALGDELQAAQSAHPSDPRAQLRAMGLAYLRYARKHPGHYAILFHTGSGARSARGTADVRQAGMEVLATLVDVVQRIGVSEPYDAACELWLALHGRASISRAMPWLTLPDEERHIDALLDAL